MMSLEEQGLLAQGCRNLLAAVLARAVKDARLNAKPGRTWPWPGLAPRRELDFFFASLWFRNICELLDIEPASVLKCVDAATHHEREGNSTLLPSLKGRDNE